MNGLGVGSVVALGDKALSDPTRQEEQEAIGSVTVGTLPALNRITNLWFSGEADVNSTCEVRLV